MQESLLKELKKKLQQEKESLEKELKSFARKDPVLRWDWDTKYPKFQREPISLDIEADEVEEYDALLPVEYDLELKLRDVCRALEKIEKGEYGKCEKCGRMISEERLKIAPWARFCSECLKKATTE